MITFRRCQMSLKETEAKLEEILHQLSENLVKAKKYNKAAMQRVRTGTIELTKISKIYRKESVASAKKQRGKKKTITKSKITKRKMASKRQPIKKKAPAKKRTVEKRKSPVKRTVIAKTKAVSIRRKTTRKQVAKRR